MYKSLRMRKTAVAFLFVLLFIPAVASQTDDYEKIISDGQLFYKYKVKSGEGLYAVSRTFNIPVNDILKANPGAVASLKNGQELLIPVLQNTPQTVSFAAERNTQQSSIDQNHTFRHTVVRGETLYGISQMYNTSVDEIIRSNSGLTENIAEGRVIAIPQQRTLSDTRENYRYHTILPKETLYAVSKTYSLKPEDLLAANPGLSVETFQTGKTIRIPFFQSGADFVPYGEQTRNVMHRVKRGETLYSISHAYDVKIEVIEKANPMLASGLKTNMEIVVPVKTTHFDEDLRFNEIDADRLLTRSKESIRTDVVRVGLLLPFLDKTDNQHLRLQEYYEGFLLAVNKLKADGVNIEVYVFEIGSKAKLESLLGTMEMEALHLIVGGMTDEQIRILSDFSKRHNIRYVVPFSSKNKEVQNNGTLFQVNPPQSYLYAKASGIFVKTFGKANVVIVNVPGKRDKDEFLSTLKGDLKRNNVRFKEIPLTSDLSTRILPLLQIAEENVIVPSTGDSDALREITNALAAINQSDRAIATRLFGYPEWQTFGADLQNSLHKYGAYFYSSFYVDEKDAETRRFLEEFKYWYGRDLINTFPKYGIFGYDTGLFFLNAVHRFGVNFEQWINRTPSNLLQFAFNFERVNNWGGFVNTGLFLIHYSNNTVYKLDKSRK